MKDDKLTQHEVYDTPIMTDEEFNNHVAAFRELFYSFALRMTMDRESAKDLMQETLMRAYGARRSFVAGTNFKAWTTTIMRNNFINDYRKKCTRYKVETPTGNDSAAKISISVNSMAYSNLMSKELNTILHELPAIHRIPFEMFFNGLDYLEIAETLRLPMGTVKSRIFFARKKLKHLIYQHYGEYVRCA